MSLFLKRFYDLKTELDEFEDWEERYTYLIEQGREISNPEVQKPENLIHGCQSHAWLQCSLKENKILLQADSESLIVKGLLSLLLKIFDQLPENELKSLDLNLIQTLKLAQHLSPSRANGFNQALLRLDLSLASLKNQKFPDSTSSSH
jgi:cysteine desulfuration protein SufE